MMAKEIEPEESKMFGVFGSTEEPMEKNV